MAKSKSKTPNPKAGKVLYNGRYLVGRQDPRGMVITATDEGREEAREAAGTSRAQNAFFDMFEDWIGNGWTWIPPEAIGALTDGDIISPDAFIEDDGSIGFDTKKPRIYWFSDYQVVDPLERWSEGESVTFDLPKMESNPGFKVSLPAQQAWDVFLNGKKIDTVFFTAPSTASEVRVSLIDHDGYDAGIKVKKSPRRENSDAHGSRSHQSWDVFLDGKRIATTYGTSASEVKDSLIEHDGFDRRIVVKTSTKKRNPEAPSATLGTGRMSALADRLARGEA